MTSVEHTKRRTFKNAMTVWTEYKNVTSKYNNGSTTYTYVCVRELQNFDGVHEGIKVVCNTEIWGFDSLF